MISIEANFYTFQLSELCFWGMCLTFLRFYFKNYFLMCLHLIFIMYHYVNRLS